MPRKGSADRKRHHFQRSFIDSAYLFVMIANAACIVRTFGAQDITTVNEGDRGILTL